MGPTVTHLYHVLLSTKSSDYIIQVLLKIKGGIFEKYKSQTIQYLRTEPWIQYPPNYQIFLTQDRESSRMCCVQTPSDTLQIRFHFSPFAFC